MHLDIISMMIKWITFAIQLFVCASLVPFFSYWGHSTTMWTKFHTIFTVNPIERTIVDFDFAYSVYPLFM